MEKTRIKQELKKRIPLKHQHRFQELVEYAGEHLSGIKRRTGENYFQHGFEVAMTTQEVASDISLLSVALCHDILVHPNGTELLKHSPLTYEERKLLKAMHALRRLHIDENTPDLDLLVRKFTEDGRLVLLRMAHRLNDVRHFSRLKNPLKKRIARETLHMYTAIAGRLSLHKWRREMEDLSFEVLHPRVFKRIDGLFKSTQELDELCLEHAVEFLKKHLKKEGLSADFSMRRKSTYSTYRKMVQKNRTFDELTDRLAIRVVVGDIPSCYQALGYIHAAMHPIPGKLKDYIGSPKENGYRSIHTVVYPLPGVTEQPIEIQIRTNDMHRECEFGVASHTEYKIWKYLLKKPEARVNIFRNLEQLRLEVRSPQQFERALRTYFRKDHLILFDHLNNLYYLKKPATALDYACMAYGDKARRMKSIRINGKIEDMSTQLNDGDVLEVRFTKQENAQTAWAQRAFHENSKNIILKTQKNTPRV